MIPLTLEAPASLAIPPRPFTVAWTVAAEALSRLVPHANNVQVVGWIDRLAELHHDSLGATREAMHSGGRMWFVARHEIDYLAEAFADERLGGATWVSSLGRSSLVRETAIWHIESGRTICRARSRWAHIDLATRRPSRPPEAERLALSHIGPDSVAQAKSMAKS